MWVYPGCSKQITIMLWHGGGLYWRVATLSFLDAFTYLLKGSNNFLDPAMNKWATGGGRLGTESCNSSLLYHIVESPVMCNDHLSDSLEALLSFYLTKRS